MAKILGICPACKKSVHRIFRNEPDGKRTPTFMIIRMPNGSEKSYHRHCYSLFKDSFEANERFDTRGSSGF